MVVLERPEVLKPFEGAFQLIDDTDLSPDERPSPLDYAAWVKDKLATLQPEDKAIVRLRRPGPTAAFSPQDTTHADYERVKELAVSQGFEPVERGTGGRLTIYDENALAITMIWPHADPHTHTLRRYEVFASLLASALAVLGIDARVGELPNEYCPGKYSINAEGRVKLVGIAQRMNRRCVQMGAIIAIDRSEKACGAIAEAYQTMGLPFDMATYGAVTELVPTLTYEKVSRVIRQTVVAGLTF
jgi:octanoyl-[GcvH]:protein N-octanoyltransferase